MKQIPDNCEGFIAGSEPGQPHILPGSIQHDCFFCDAPTMISPEGEEFIRAKPGLLLVCLDCADEMVTQGMPAMLTPGSAQLLRDEWIKENRN